MCVDICTITSFRVITVVWSVEKITYDIMTSWSCRVLHMLNWVRKKMKLYCIDSTYIADFCVLVEIMFLVTEILWMITTHLHDPKTVKSTKLIRSFVIALRSHVFMFTALSACYYCHIRHMNWKHSFITRLLP